MQILPLLTLLNNALLKSYIYIYIYIYKSYIICCN